MKKILVVDVRLIAFKTFYNKSNIIDTIKIIYNVAYKYSNTYNKIIFAWDSKAGSVRRKQLYKEYKAHRKDKIKTQKEKDRLKLFNSNFTKLNESLSFIGNVIDLYGYEADDIANIIADRFKDENYIIHFLSSDVDWGVNLISNNYRQLHLSKGILDYKSFYSTFNIQPKYILHAQAIMGVDKENIKGVYKLGKGRLYNLFDKYNNIDDVIFAIQQWVDENKYGIKLPDGFNSVDELYKFNYNILKPVYFTDLTEEEQEEFKTMFNSKKSDYNNFVKQVLVDFNYPFILTEREKKFFKII